MIRSAQTIKSLARRLCDSGTLDPVDREVIDAAVETMLSFHNRRTGELLLANNAEVERRRAAEAALAGLLRERINGVPLAEWEGSPAIDAARAVLHHA